MFKRIKRFSQKLARGGFYISIAAFSVALVVMGAFILLENLIQILLISFLGVVLLIGSYTIYYRRWKTTPEITEDKIIYKYK